MLAHSAKRDHGIEHRTARPPADGLAILEYNVKDGFSYSYYFSHLIVMCFCCKIAKW
jgi:hypothetical protein